MRLREELEQIRREIAEVRSLVGPFGAVMPDGTVLVQTLYGTKYYLPYDDFIMTPQLIVYRQWEEVVTKFILSRLTDDTVFVDVGANIGYFTCIVASKLGAGSAGKVFAYEANPAVAALLRRNLEVNWSLCPVEMVEVAVSDEAAELSLNVPTGHAANASFGAMSGAAAADVRQVTVQAKPLDELVPDGQRVDLVKIDVEGWELPVLRGMRRLLADNPHAEVVCEWSADQMDAAGHPREGFVAFLEELSLRPFSIERNEWIPLGDLPSLPYGNLFLTRAA